MSLLNTVSQATDFVATNTKPARKRGKAPKQFELLQMASSSVSFDTKKAAREALKAGGFVSTDVVVENLLGAAVHIASERKTRPSRVIKYRLGHALSQTTAVQTTKPVLLPR